MSNPPEQATDIIIIGEETLREIMAMVEDFAKAMMKHKLSPGSLLSDFSLPPEDRQRICLFLAQAPMLMAQLVQAVISQQEVLRIVMFEDTPGDDDTLQ